MFENDFSALLVWILVWFAFGAVCGSLAMREYLHRRAIRDCELAQLEGLEDVEYDDPMCEEVVVAVPASERPRIAHVDVARAIEQSEARLAQRTGATMTIMHPCGSVQTVVFSADGEEVVTV